MTNIEIQEIGFDPITYLSSAFEIKKQISIKRKRVEMLRHLAQSVSIQMSQAPSGGGYTSDKVANGVLAIMEVIEEIDDCLLEMARVQQSLEEVLTQYVYDEKYRSVLEMRYLACQSWNDVANTLGITTRWAMTLHERAVKELSTNCLNAVL